MCAWASCGESHPDMIRLTPTNVRRGNIAYSHFRDEKAEVREIIYSKPRITLRLMTSVGLDPTGLHKLCVRGLRDSLKGPHRFQHTVLEAEGVDGPYSSEAAGDSRAPAFWALRPLPAEQRQNTETTRLLEVWIMLQGQGAQECAPVIGPVSS